MTDPLRPLVVVMSGSRGFRDVSVVQATLLGLRSLHPTVVLRVGDAPSGLDLLVRTHARRIGLAPTVWEAEWDTFDKAAGMIRNRDMLAGPPKADLLLAFYAASGASPGTQGCIKAALRKGVRAWLHREGKGVPVFREVKTAQDYR